jgi:hypothetical protein
MKRFGKVMAWAACGLLISAIFVVIGGYHLSLQVHGHEVFWFGQASERTR